MAKRKSIRKYRVQKKRGKLLKSLSRQARWKLTKRHKRHKRHKKHKKHSKHKKQRRSHRSHMKSIRGGFWPHPLRSAATELKKKNEVKKKEQSLAKRKAAGEEWTRRFNETTAIKAASNQSGVWVDV